MTQHITGELLKKMIANAAVAIENHKNEIKARFNTQTENLNIVVNHINRNKKVVIKELIKELKK